MGKAKLFNYQVFMLLEAFLTNLLVHVFKFMVSQLHSEYLETANSLHKLKFRKYTYSNSNKISKKIIGMLSKSILKSLGKNQEITGNSLNKPILVSLQKIFLDISQKHPIELA